ncbi:intraflagellar transport protein [Histomonas meleagridis]|uniref:intraflagellar transport protein 81-like n=1 Tax=Histomonas meleagridis TaxID=135588 RepID=UPI00355A6566|nr:intraflagellar transport protein [Histomonas meleagridis]KAH0799907.1 intraflagellar transport protein 81-like [Histomonas meleagridis]
MKFTLFQFSELSGRELLELFNTILYKISDTMPEKIGTEKIEATVERMSEFLRVLQYEFPCEPEEWDVRFGNADKELIHPAMLWLLNDFDEMKKRAYKAKFFEEVPIPDEIKVDPTVAELITQQNELREQFDAALTEYNEVGSTNVDELKKVIQELESNKARIATRISSFKRKLSNVPNIDELLKWTSKIREENEREVRLEEQQQKLTEEKRLLIHRQEISSNRIQNIRSHMESQLISLRNAVAEFRNQGKNQSSSPNEKSVAFCQQQVIAANKRLAQKQRQLSDIQKARAEAEQQLQEKQETGAIEVPTGKDFTAFVRTLKIKNDNYKELQSQLALQKRELAIMMRTEEIVLQHQEKSHKEVLKIEQQRGVGGFRDAREKLEKVSAAKADLDDLKGKTLEEMSSIVKEIQQSIQARQNELKPYVVRLQNQRKDTAAVESKYLQAKKRYTNAVSEYDSVCMELDEESKKLRVDISNYQSKYFSIMTLMQSLERTLKRANDEKNAIETGNPISKDMKTYSDFFQKSAHVMKKQMRELKEQKKTVGTQSETNQKQLDAFQNLRRLLQVKLECLKVSKKEKEEKLSQEEKERQNTEERLEIV